jgi:hypothetical protein
VTAAMMLTPEIAGTMIVGLLIAVFAICWAIGNGGEN